MCADQAIAGPLMGVDEFIRRGQQPGRITIDARFTLGQPDSGRQAYRDGHIPGAFYLDLEQDLSGLVGPATGRHPLPESARLAGLLGGLGVGPAREVVVYDEASGAMAARLWWLLRWLGHARVRLLDGGLAAWLAAGQPLSTDQAEPHPEHFAAQPGSMPVVTTAQLVNAAPGRYLILDARAAVRFRGESEPIDPVAGHIPGAVNLPFGDTLRPDGRFRPASELRSLYLSVIGDRSPADVVCMCGSGVTACHALVAMEQAGLPGGSLYAGSWSEWIRSPQRPIARG